MNNDRLKSCKNIEVTQPTDTPIFSRKEWYSALERSICNNTNTPHIINTHDQKYQCIIPMTESYNGITRRLKSMTNFYSPFYKPVCNREITESTHQIIISTCHDTLKNFNIIDIAPLYEADAKTWNSSLSTIGFKCHTYQHSTNWYHSNILGVDEYWSSRPNRLIQIINNKKNKLHKSGEYRIEISQAKDLRELQKKLSHYHHIYYDSWKKVEPHPYFIDSICQHAWEKNELRIGIIYHHDFPVAAQIWFVNYFSAYIFKLAYRCSYRRTSIGTILTAAMIEHVIDLDKVNCIDFLTGDDNFKKDWMKSSRPIMGVQACNTTTWTGKVYYTTNKLSTLRRKLYNQ